MNFSISFIISVASITAPRSDSYTSRTYPTYCTTTEQHSQFEVPPLDTTIGLLAQTSSIKLKHVTSVLRHGATTPFSRHDCWPSYLLPTEDTSKWDCSLSTLVSPPAYEALSLLDTQNLQFGEMVGTVETQNEVTFLSGFTPSFQFEKRYDANLSPSGSTHFPPNLGNHLGGSCELGQLTLRGYVQEEQNGYILRNAYVKDSRTALNTGKNPNLLLFNFDEEASITSSGYRAYDEPSLYFRSDDTQSTIMSGQTVIRHIFKELMKVHQDEHLHGEHNPVIRVHTTDRDRDFLSPNSKLCPRLDELEAEAKSSDEYKMKFEWSKESQTMKSLANDFLGGWWRHDDPNVAIDCYMTTACSDRTLPHVLNVDTSVNDSHIIDRFGEDIISRWTKFHTEKKSFIYKYKDAAYSQIATNPLWNDILSGLLSFTNADKYEMSETWPDLRLPSKLAVYSADGSTIMTLLSSLGQDVWDGTEWPPYASMLNIELYEVNFEEGSESGTTWELEETYPTKIAFRLIYNGKDLTQKISGCPLTEQLCDIDILIMHVFGFSQVNLWSVQCNYGSIPEVSTFDDDETPDENIVGDKAEKTGSSAVGATFAFLGIAIAFTSCGALGMYVFLTSPSHSIPIVGSENQHSIMRGSSLQFESESVDEHSFAPQTSALII